ncbi:DUF4038 domain-containing protein [Bifidobacterium callimiconis]|uniref:apiosidase-like domain-containing protein n=1 Tax=Bifidobacterium callimiconis TaxID=2306973 RepID=UPI001BDC9423|nr:DUF4038 domain-containing protein [Bifidobacterium callimiconis]MBT1176452.1 DUF4038 domain-containing protein [Bifidobacterium callimiconis]
MTDTAPFQTTLGRLRIADDGRHFIGPDGTPFVWIADTAWTLPQRVMWQDVDHYLRLRRAQGFTVIQLVALDPERDERMRDPAGNPALIDDDVTRPNEAYFRYLDSIIDRAAELGLYVLLLPAWGQLVVGDNWMGQTFDRIVTADNAFAYGAWIGRRYRDRGNIIWCMGGDRMPVHKGIDYRPVWRSLAEGVAHGATGRRPHWNQADPVWRDIPMTYHPCHENETGLCSTMSYWTDDDRWISFVMLQSGHGADARNWQLVNHEYRRDADGGRVMPVWDGEPAYEEMPTSFPEFTDFHDDWMVRRRAYWSLFAGAFGFTYGHCSVWSSIGERERDAMFRHTWYESLTAPGAEQMKHLHALVEDLNLPSFRPCQKLLPGNTDDLRHHAQACISPDNALACIYLPTGGDITVDATTLREVLPDAGSPAGDVPGGVHPSVWWFDPRTGALVSDMITESTGTLLRISAPTVGDGNDWILLLSSTGRPPIYDHEYGERPGMATSPIKVFDWN